MQMAQEEHRNKSILQTFLEKLSWEEISDEHYGKKTIDEELPRGTDLQIHFFKNSNKRYLKWRLKQD